MADQSTMERRKNLPLLLRFKEVPEGEIVSQFRFDPTVMGLREECGDIMKMSTKGTMIYTGVYPEVNVDGTDAPDGYD